MRQKFVWGGIALGLATVLAFAVAWKKKGVSIAGTQHPQKEQRQFREMLKPQPNVVKHLGRPPKTTTPAENARQRCGSFYRAMFDTDFSSVAADRMNHLPSGTGCVPEAPLLKGAVEKYESTCIKDVSYPARYAAWTKEQKDHAKACLTWAWFLRSAILADRLKDENPGNIADAAMLSTWLFGSFLAFDFERIPVLAARLVEVDPNSVLGAKAGLVKSLAAIGELDGTKPPTGEAFWADAERDWRRANELAPGDPEVEFAGVMIRTRNMDLPRLKKELDERQAAHGGQDSLGAYLEAYYLSKTQSKEAAAAVLDVRAKQYPAEAARFKEAAETCRTKPKCEFELRYRLEVTNLLKTDDVLH